MTEENETVETEVVADQSIYDLFGTSAAASEEGKWFDLSPKISIKLRRLKSKKSRKVREKLEAPYKHLLRNGALPQDVQDDLADKQIAEAIIVDWKGFTDTKGQPMPYSPAAALKLIRALPDLRDEIASICLRMDHFRDEESSEIAKN